MNEEVIKKLQSSPMFQLSLASKELFHGNFLYWLWKAESDIFWSVMKYFEIERDDEIVVRREWENFDLSLVRMGNRMKRVGDEETEYVADVVAVIENKVKSLPRKEQLEGYDEKIEHVDKDTKCTKILLSLPELDFDLTGMSWKYIGYEEYVEVLKANKDKVTSPYNRAVLGDYCQLLDTLCTLKEEWLCGDDEAFLKKKYTSILKSNDEKEMRELRINDIRHKIIYSKMGELLQVKIGPLSSKAAAGSAFTNSTGIVESNIFMKKTYDFDQFGIQVQGPQYRRFIIKGKKKLSDDECISQISTSFPEQCLGVAFKHDGKKMIGSYGETFKYLYHLIDDNMTIGDVLEQMAKDIRHIISKYNNLILDKPNRK